MTTSQTYPWWETGIVYQIYPRSFQDSNGDGIGDLKGIQSRLPYLQKLGITAIWLSPIYPSPMVDFGYDVSDYTDIHPLFGSLDDFAELLDEVHERGMKLILDFVPNHTSDRHVWFQESRSSRNNRKRDWYIWKDAKPDGSPPNNWQSYFASGSAWEWDEATGQYYLHLFTKEQPDLNWRNPKVERAMLDNLRFWLDRGVDGFRVDVIAFVIKDADFRDELEFDPTMSEVDALNRRNRTQNQPEVHDVIKKMRAVLDEYGERALIGELFYPYEKLVTYYGKNLDECHLPFNFWLIFCPFTAKDVQKLVNSYEKALIQGAWPNWVLGNHDQDRVASECRVGEVNARLAHTLLLTLRGTPTIYYGDELGMPNVDIPPSQYVDPMASGVGRSRDLERTPMQWDDSLFAGFSTIKPWLPVAKDYASRNVQVQEHDPKSMLSMIKKLIAIRQNSPALNHGSYLDLSPKIDGVMVYMRSHGRESMIIALNFSDEEQIMNLAGNSQKCQILLSTYMDREEETLINDLRIRPHEGLVMRMIY